MTDLYIEIPIADQIAALNRAALIIDGDPKENVIALAVPATNGTNNGTARLRRIGQGA